MLFALFFLNPIIDNHANFTTGSIFGGDRSLDQVIDKPSKKYTMININHVVRILNG